MRLTSQPYNSPTREYKQPKAVIDKVAANSHPCEATKRTLRDTFITSASNSALLKEFPLVNATLSRVLQGNSCYTIQL